MLSPSLRLRPSLEIDTLTLTLNFGSSSDHISQSPHDDTFSSSEKTGNYLIIVRMILIINTLRMDEIKIINVKFSS